MIRIETCVAIQAAIATVFDAERNVSFHTSTQSHRGERAVDGVTSGLLKLDDQVEWEALHFGIRQRLRVRISEMNRPIYFKDEMTKGIFKSFSHEHHFSEIDPTTTLKKRHHELLGPIRITWTDRRAAFSPELHEEIHSEKELGLQDSH